MFEGICLTQHTIIRDPAHIVKVIPGEGADSYIKKKNEINRRTGDVVNITCAPVYKQEPRNDDVHRISSTGIITGLYLPRIICNEPTLRQTFEQTRAIDNTPQPSESTAFATKQTRSLSGYFTTKDITVKSDKEAWKHVDAWYAFGQSKTEESDDVKELMGMRAHYARMDPKTEVVYPGDEYACSETTYIRFFAPQQISCSHPYGSRATPNLILRVFHDKVAADEKVMKTGVDSFMNVPIEKFEMDKKAPSRVEFEIDFLGIKIESLNHREKVWWAGEVFRVNAKKDGMRIVWGKLNEKVAQAFGLGEKTVRRGAADIKPLNLARGKIASFVKPIAKTSKVGSGFKGISGDWKLIFQKKVSSRWMQPWLIG